MSFLSIASIFVLVACACGVALGFVLTVGRANNFKEVVVIATMYSVGLIVALHHMMGREHILHEGYFIRLLLTFLLAEASLNLGGWCALLYRKRQTRRKENTA